MDRRIQGAAVSAERTESPWMLATLAVDLMNSFLPERADTGRSR